MMLDITIYVYTPICIIFLTFLPSPLSYKYHCFQSYSKISREIDARFNCHCLSRQEYIVALGGKGYSFMNLQPHAMSEGVRKCVFHAEASKHRSRSLIKIADRHAGAHE